MPIKGLQGRISWAVLLTLLELLFCNFLLLLQIFKCHYFKSVFLDTSNSKLIDIMKYLILLLLILLFNSPYAGDKFVKISPTGLEVSDSAFKWSCVKHNVTGQIWEVKTRANKDDSYTFDNASDYARQINKNKLCGYSDWRVPSIKELNSISDKNTYKPAVDRKYFPNIHPSDYWSKSSYAEYSEYAWSIYFYNGYLYYYEKQDDFYVRLVRGGEYFDFFDYTKLDASGNSLPSDNTNHVCVRDNHSGLTWEVKTRINKYLKYTHSKAIVSADKANQTNLCGYSDWRIPDFDELITLIDYKNYSPAIKTSYFPNTISSKYWTGSPNAKYPHNILNIYFYDGDLNYSSKPNDRHVRLVRGR